MTLEQQTIIELFEACRCMSKICGEWLNSEDTRVLETHEHLQEAFNRITVMRHREQCEQELASIFPPPE